MARTDYYGIQTPVLQATSQAIRTVNGTVGTIAPEDYPDLISAMHSQSDYENALDQMVEETASGDIVSFADGANDIPVKSLIANVDPIQSGTGDPSPDNVRPITGRTSATVTHMGINQWDEEWEFGSINNSDGTNVTSSVRIRSKNYIVVKPNTSICVVNTNSVKIFIYKYGKDKSFLGMVDTSGLSSGNQVVNIPNDCYYLRFRSNDNYTYSRNISFNYPSSDTEYHAYVGETYTKTFPLCYGGKLNLTTGALKFTHGIITLNGSETWTKSVSYSGGYYMNGWVFNNSIVLSTDHIQNRLKTVNSISEYAQTINCCFFDNSLDIRVDNSLYPTVADFKAWLSENNVQVVYPLADPPVAVLTKEEIKTFLGGNTFYADTGDVEVTYRANGQLYIEQH